MPPLVHIHGILLLCRYASSEKWVGALEVGQSSSLLRGSNDVTGDIDSDDADLGEDDAEPGRMGVDFMASRGSGSKKLDFSAVVENEPVEQFDLLVIGGGSAGLSVAKSFTSEFLQIHTLHKKYNHRQPKVAIADFVEPTPIHGNTWGVGGTCLLVGCAPKKLMHVASRFATSAQSEKYGDLLHRFGWEDLEAQQNRTHNFGTFLTEIRYHLDGLSEAQAAQLEGTPGLAFFRRTKASFTRSSESGKQVIRLDTYRPASGGQLGFDPEPVETVHVEASVVVIAVGSRPRQHEQLMAAGGRNVVSSDDFFHLLEQDPRKVIVVGGGYTALELASALKGLDPSRNVSVAYRSSLLNGFEPWLTSAVRDSMESLPGGGVTFEHLTVEEIIAQERHKDATVVLATGRKGNADSLGLPFPLNSSLDGSGRLRICYLQGIENTLSYVDEQGHSECAPNVFAVGDVVSGLPELATRARLEGSRIGRTAARMLFGDGSSLSASENLELNGLPSVLFAPLELFDWKAPGYEGRPILEAPCPNGKCTFKAASQSSLMQKTVPQIVTEKLVDLPLAWAPLAWAKSDRDTGRPVFSDWVSESIPPTSLVCGLVVVRHKEGRIVRLGLAHPHGSEVGQGLVWGLEAWWRNGLKKVTPEALERGAARIKQNDVLSGQCEEASALVPHSFTYKLPQVQGDPGVTRPGRPSVVEKAISSVESMFLQASLSESVVEQAQGWRISGKSEGLRGNLTEFKIYAPLADSLGLGLVISELSQTVSAKGASKRGRSTRVLPPAYPIHPTLGESLTQRPSDASVEVSQSGPPTCCG